MVSKAVELFKLIRINKTLGDLIASTVIQLHGYRLLISRKALSFGFPDEL